jgi:hypothetical protein
LRSRILGFLCCAVSAAAAADTASSRAALLARDAQYDAAERMIRRPFSSPGYHTTLTGGTVHPTRDSLEYALALLDSGEAERLGRAEDILRRVIALQDQDPASRTYGIWSWFLEEPLERMSPPDWNWADFCGVQLLGVALRHRQRIAPELAAAVKASILHAASSIQRRNVGPGYTNIALMGSYVTIAAGELFEDEELRAYGTARLRRFHEHTRANGSFEEYNSPTYTVVALEEIARMRADVKDPPTRRLLEDLHRFAWRHIARRFHPPTGQWAGPHSRSYRTLLGGGTRAFLEARRGCPDDLAGLFDALAAPRTEIETFRRAFPPAPAIVGTTCLHPAYALGSVNCGDLWNQRRPLIAYGGTVEKPCALRVRCLHDGYDYASASIFSVQEGGDVLSAVVFALDRGDTHISLDRIKDGTMQASDLRVRLELEGAAPDGALPASFSLDGPTTVRLGEATATLWVPLACLDGAATATETGKEGDRAWLDVVLYHGDRRAIDFRRLEQAAVLLALYLRGPGEGAPLPAAVAVTVEGGIAKASLERPGAAPLRLSVPLKPLGTKEQQARSGASIGERDPWQSTDAPDPFAPLEAK